MSSPNPVSNGYVECPVDPTEPKNCPICFEDITVNMVAHAAINNEDTTDQTKWHHLHKNCLQQWVSQKGDPEALTIACPACNKVCQCINIPEITFPKPKAIEDQKLRDDINEMTARLQATRIRVRSNRNNNNIR